MATLTDPHPPTNEREVQLHNDLALVEDRLQDIAILIRACYREEGQPAARAEETAAALQRQKWELETKLLKQAVAQPEGIEKHLRASHFSQCGPARLSGVSRSGKQSNVALSNSHQSSRAKLKSVGKIRSVLNPLEASREVRGYPGLSYSAGMGTISRYRFCIAPPRRGTKIHFTYFVRPTQC
jgi:hypothetical protein